MPYLKPGPTPPPTPKKKPAPRRSAERVGSSSQVSNPRHISHYENVHVNEGINWRKVDPKIIIKLNRLARQTGRTVTITSGFRTNAEQTRLYNQLAPQGGVVAAPGTSPHEFGHAVDALVGGSPIGDVFTPEQLASVGLKSLASINDAVHIERLHGGDYAAAPVQGHTTIVHSNYQPPDEGDDVGRRDIGPYEPLDNVLYAPGFGGGAVRDIRNARRSHRVALMAGMDPE